MYHSVNRSPHKSAETVTPETFEQQLQWLLARYAVVRLSDLAAGTDSRRDGRRRVAITFDDGLQDFCDVAYPILRKHAVPCTMFVPTAFLGRYDVMSGADLLFLQSEGLVEFGSHTVDHVSMRQLPIEEMTRQARESKRALERLLDRPVRLFAYPFGQLQNFSAASGKVLEAAGYELAVTASWGTVRPGDDPLALRRVSFGEHDDEETLRAKVDGEYDWKAMKARVGFLVHTLGDRLRGSFRVRSVS
jgi:peptidoglycan/xylan/chitin deacetylase (PgdA/CDA1 family)